MSVGVAFVVGALIGALIGIALMALMAAADRSDDG